MKKTLAVICGLLLAGSLALPVGAEQITAQTTVDEEMAANDFTVGNIVTFGAYEQDNDLDNGEEPIEWIVLEVDGGRVLLISRYCLDAQPYNTYLKKITWGRCSLHRWLNYNFLREAFIVEERDLIATTEVINDDSTYYDSYGGKDTEDQVFLFSYDEALQYFPTEEDRQALPTAYAIANGAYVDEDTGYTWWWLRSPGVDNTNACGVRSDGRISGYGSRDVNRTSGAIRPVIWLNIGE
ncbi:MAG TPA: DUF6273 domain-containing protein [Candidatus Limiplasma sp.]|nr:DUF6273 domain-containing protein [Candidatus Limiplasma sp.]